MRRLIRPLIITVLVSFTLGIWFSLEKSEKNLLTALQDHTKIKILTTDPLQWQPLVIPLREQKAIELVVESVSDLTQFASRLESPDSSCDLVAVHSIFAQHLINEHHLKKLDLTQIPSTSLLAADFRALSFDPSGQFLVPILWTVSEWRATDTATNKKLTSVQEALESTVLKGRIGLYTSADDLLLLASDLNLATQGEAESDLDLTEPIARLKGQVQLQFGGAPPANMQLVRIFGTQSMSSGDPNHQFLDSSELPLAPTDDLQLLNLGVCKYARQSQLGEQIIDWVLEGHIALELAAARGWGVTTTQAEHIELPAQQKPSGLRGRELSRLTIRSVPWEFAAAWTRQF